MIPGEPGDEADVQFEDLERIFYMSEMICRPFNILQLVAGG